jgi:hypothetical protein
MKLNCREIHLHVDTSKVNDPPPATDEERIAWCNDALSQANNMLKHKYGISFTAYVEAPDITVEP